MVKEKTVERALVNAAQAAGGYAIKLTNTLGIPDRLVILPGGKIGFAELKTPIGKLSGAQNMWKVRIEKLGFRHFVPRTSREAEQTIFYIERL